MSREIGSGVEPARRASGLVRSLSLRGKALTTVVSALLGLILAEGSLRALGITAAPQPTSRGMLFRVSKNRSLTFENAPDAVRRTEYRETHAGPARIVEQRVNAQGFRGPEVTLAKPPGTLRIACIGDSHTFGTGVSEDETWPALLDDILSHQAPPAVEVMNCGVSAYDTLREVLWMEQRVLPYDPDLVVLQYYVNDSVPRDAFGLKPPAHGRLRALCAPGRGGWIGRLRAVSRAADVVLDRAWRRLELRVESGAFMEGYGENDPGWQRVRSGLCRARDALEERGISFAVVLYPFLLRDGPVLSSHRAFRLVSELCAQEGVACFDAESAFLRHDVEELRVHPLDFHANGRANAIFAGAVARWLQKSDLPPSPAPER